MKKTLEPLNPQPISALRPIKIKRREVCRHLISFAQTPAEDIGSRREDERAKGKSRLIGWQEVGRVGALLVKLLLLELLGTSWWVVVLCA